MISIDWGTKIISVPKSYTTLIQASPTEIRELPLNQFRLDLKALEDDAEGIPHLVTHRHNTETILGGITYARTIEIINGYTVTFENGAYAVNLTGANSNVGDVVNVNQVSVRSANAAGLISSAAIEFASFNGAVTIDALNGVSGTVFPKGTQQAPVNNVADAKLIADVRGLKRFNIVGNFTFTTGDNVEDFEVYGINPNKTTLIFESGALTEGVDIFNATVQGEFDNLATFEDCRLLDVQMVEGYAFQCLLAGTFVVSGVGQTAFIDCWDGIVQNGTYPVIDCGGSGRDISIKNWHGDVKIINKTGADDMEINMNSGGTVLVDSTVTNGLVRCTGSMKVIDNSTGTANVNISEVAFPELSQYAAFENASVWLDPTTSNTGSKFPTGTQQRPVNNDSDAQIIASNNSLFNITARSAVTITGTHSNIKFFGRSPRTTQITIDAAATLFGCEFESCLLSGELGTNGSAYFTQVAMKNLNGIFGHAERCVFREGTIGILPNGLLMANKCAGVSAPNPGTDIPIIDCNGTGRIAMRQFSGEATIINKTGGNDCSLSLLGATVTLDSTVTSGNWRVTGTGILIDNSTGTAVVDTSGLVAPEYLQDSVYVDTEAVLNGSGTPGDPFNNIADAIDYAENIGLKKIYTYSEIVLDRNLKNFTILGVGNPVVDLNGYNVKGTEIYNCKLRGDYIESLSAQNCILDNAFHLNGIFVMCGLNGDLICNDGDVEVIDCYSVIPGSGRPTISLSGAGATTMSVRSYSGGLTIKDINNAGDVVTVEMSQGKLTADSTCTQGELSVRGVTQFTDNSNGTVVDTTGLLSTELFQSTYGYARKASDNAEQANLKL